MTKLQAVQDTSTNWTAAEWREIEALKKVLAQSDNRSGTPWVIGAKVNKLAPRQPVNPRRAAGGVLAGQDPTRDRARLQDLALEVGETPRSLMDKANVELAWAPADRVSGVSWSVFRSLAGQPNRKAVLAQLLREKAAFDITDDDARRAIGGIPSDPVTTTERLARFYSTLEGFPSRLRTQTDINFARQIINRLEILIGEAEEEAV
jgi:hypothetical protein